MKKFLYGLFNLLAIVVSTVFVSLYIYFFSFLIFIAPIGCVKKFLKKMLGHAEYFWIDAIKFCLFITHNELFHFKKTNNCKYELNKNDIYIIISNHSSWIDIILLHIVFHRKIKALKFFLKKELLFSLPFAGLATKLLGYPLIIRPSRKQIRKDPSIKMYNLNVVTKFCKKLKDSPSSLVNFIEGTRFSMEKHKKQNPPYKKLLRPSYVGLSSAIFEVSKWCNPLLIDATLGYVPKTPSFWDFCCGNISKIVCEYSVCNIDKKYVGNYLQDRNFKENFRDWINSMWAAKDKRIEEINGRYEN